MITPREMLRDYMTVLDILSQNPEADFARVVGESVKLETPNTSDEDAWAPTSDEIAAGRVAPSAEQKRTFSPEDLEF